MFSSRNVFSPRTPSPRVARDALVREVLTEYPDLQAQTVADAVGHAYDRASTLGFRNLDDRRLIAGVLARDGLDSHRARTAQRWATQQPSAGRS